MALSKDQKLFESYLALVLRPAYGIAYYLLQNSEEAEALVQEAALRACLSFPLYQTGTSFTVWFMGFLVGVFVEQPRPEGQPSLPVAWEELPEGEQEASAPLLPQEHPSALFAVLTAPQIAGAFAQLPEQGRLIVALYFMEDLSYQQIADILGCSVPQVRLYLHRGRWVLYHLLYALAQTSHKTSLP